MYATIYRKFAVLLFFILDYSDALPGKVCKIPSADAGTCTVVNKCDPLYELQKKRPKTAQEETFFRQSVASCGSSGAKLKVCCPPPSQWTKLVIRPVEYPEPPISIAHANEVLAPGDNTDNTVLNRIQDPPPPPLTLNVPTESNEGKLTSWFTKFMATQPTNEPITESCGLDTSSAQRIVGGNATEIDEYPWLALLEYDDRFNRFKCGGSLVSKRHVLTAAHCLYIPPIYVRLSEYNLTTEPTDVVDVNGGGKDYITVQIMQIEWTAKHQGHVFHSYFNDIGLIKMKQEAVFGDFIKPICLPTEDYRGTNFFNGSTRFTVAGWGTDNQFSLNSEVKRSVYLPYVTNDVCREIFSSLTETQQMCAGGEEGIDSCRGDSGGPLMYEDKGASQFVVVGIVSSGKPKCGTKNSPGIYTYVYEYVGWIKDTIKKNGNV